MRTLLTAAAVALSLSAGSVMADDLDDLLAPVDQPNTVFDLGIDVTNVGATRGAVVQFLGSLAPDTRRIILATCDHYMEAPVTATEQDTLSFCSLATGG